MLPDSFISILRRLRSVFTAPSFANFIVLIAGFVHALAGHRLTDAIRAAGPAASKHYTTYYRFFCHACKSLDELGFALIERIVELLDLIEVELVLDDTLAHRTSKKVALAGMHADPLLKGGVVAGSSPPTATSSRSCPCTSTCRRWARRDGRCR